MSKRRAGWWWIDRWRKSTAYTDMTIEEQGAYRNLLDELWLRDGVLPNDERILAKISGDALAWERVRVKVLARFEVTTHGLRHSTHDEVAAKSAEAEERQREKGKARAEKAARDPAGRFQPLQPADQPDDQPPNQPSGSGSVLRTPLPDQEPKSASVIGPALPADGNGAPKMSLTEYKSEIASVFHRETGRPETQEFDSVEFALCRRWYEHRYPLRIVLTAIEETKDRRSARRLQYFGPSVEEAFRRWFRATGQSMEAEA